MSDWFFVSSAGGEEDNHAGGGGDPHSSDRRPDRERGGEQQPLPPRSTHHLPCHRQEQVQRRHIFLHIQNTQTFSVSVRKEVSLCESLLPPAGQTQTYRPEDETPAVTHNAVHR